MTLDIERYTPEFDVAINHDIQKELRKNVMSLTVEDSIDGASTFSLNLYEKLDIKNGEYKWLDSKLLDPTKCIEIDIHIKYSNSSANLSDPIFSGYITALNPGFPSSGIPSLSVQGLDRSFLLQMSDKRAVFDENDDLSAIIEKIATPLGFSFNKANAPKIKPKKKQAMDPQESDYTFLKDMADRFGFEFFVRGKELYFRKPAYSEEHKMTLRWGREILSFSPRMSSAGIITKAIVMGYSHDQKSKKIEGSSTLDDLGFKEKNAISAIKAIKASRVGSSEVIKRDIPISNEEEAKEIAKAILEKANYSLIEGTCECIGLPKIRPGTNIIIDKVGNRFSGKYYVKKATHNLGENGYITTLDICRGGFGKC